MAADSTTRAAGCSACKGRLTSGRSTKAGTSSAAHTSTVAAAEPFWMARCCAWLRRFVSDSAAPHRARRRTARETASAPSQPTASSSQQGVDTVRPASSRNTAAGNSSRFSSKMSARRSAASASRPTKGRAISARNSPNWAGVPPAAAARFALKRSFKLAATAAPN